MTDQVAIIPKSPAEVAKAILLIAVALVASLRASLAGGVSPAEALQLVLLFVTLIPVYLFAGTTVKTAVTFVSAGLQALAVPFAALVGWSAWSTITIDDWIGAALTAFAAIGIAVVPNKPPARHVVISGSPVDTDRLAETLASIDRQVRR